MTWKSHFMRFSCHGTFNVLCLGLAEWENLKLLWSYRYYYTYLPFRFTITNPTVQNWIVWWLNKPWTRQCLRLVFENIIIYNITAKSCVHLRNIMHRIATLWLRQFLSTLYKLRDFVIRQTPYIQTISILWSRWSFACKQAPRSCLCRRTP